MQYCNKIFFDSTALVVFQKGNLYGRGCHWTEGSDQTAVLGPGVRVRKVFFGPEKKTLLHTGQTSESMTSDMVGGRRTQRGSLGMGGSLIGYSVPTPPQWVSGSG